MPKNDDGSEREIFAAQRAELQAKLLRGEIGHHRYAALIQAIDEAEEKHATPLGLKRRDGSPLEGPYTRSNDEYQAERKAFNEAMGPAEEAADHTCWWKDGVCIIGHHGKKEGNVMTQREKDEMIADLAGIAIQAEVVVAAVPFDEGSNEPGDVAIDRLSDLLDAYNAKWGEPGA